MNKVTIKNKKAWKSFKNGYIFEDQYNKNIFINEEEPKHYPCVAILNDTYYNDGMYSETKITFVYKKDLEI